MIVKFCAHLHNIDRAMYMNDKHFNDYIGNFIGRFEKLKKKE